jgi:predicted  nucleic acid-binding Zn ribbon protein
MYIQEISIEIKSKVNKDELIGAFVSLMASYLHNGQTQGPIESQYITGDKIVCLAYTLEKKSLDKKYNNFYVNSGSKKVEEFCDSKLIYKTVGKLYDSGKASCTCRKSDFYILTTSYISIDSPLTCGTCSKSVPLYKLPIYHDYGYLPILNWETNYISCDRLQMNGEVGERWALNQMEEITSPLSRQGLAICKKINELTAVSTYYYLHNYSKFKGDKLSRPCPGCNKKWGLKETLHNRYDFKCDRCKIVSELSPNA